MDYVFVPVWQIKGLWYFVSSSLLRWVFFSAAPSFGVCTYAYKCVWECVISVCYCWWWCWGGGGSPVWDSVCKSWIGVCHCRFMQSDLFIYTCYTSLKMFIWCLLLVGVMKAGFLDGCTYQTFCSRGRNWRKAFLTGFQAALGLNCTEPF